MHVLHERHVLLPRQTVNLFKDSSPSPNTQPFVRHVVKIIRNRIKLLLPHAVIGHLEMIAYHLRLLKYLFWGRPCVRGETSKAKLRRKKESFFSYCEGMGLDIGYGGDLVTPNAQGFDMEHGDAMKLPGISRNTYDFVYSSHTLEHMPNPDIALLNWWNCVKLGGYLIIYVPERNLYEKKRTLPSRWNLDHKWFFLLDKDDPPHTIGILPLVKRTLTKYSIVYAKICKEGHTIADPNVHSDGEYSIEIIIQKNKDSRVLDF